ncbi:MAG: DNA-processing protein DprA [Actinomycetota bacterium]|nr:DNA-processing protein DprA [Actinomycetota bacterium]
MSVQPGEGPGSQKDARRACAWLSRAVEPGHAAMHGYVASIGPVAAARALAAARAPAHLQALVGARHDEDRVDADLAAAQGVGARLLGAEDPEWPAEPLHAMTVATAMGLDGIAPPVALWVRGNGDLAELTLRAVAIVGSRACTTYGSEQAAALAFGLAERGWTVISGGAFGIDAAAHRGALSAGAATIAVLAGGIDRCYPAAHAALFERIAKDGLLVSEWPPGCAPYRHRFLIRNRLIAALSAGCVVVEASARSGARHTAGRAAELGRPVMAVPGPVTSAMSVGTHSLLRDTEARLVTGVEHVIEEIGRLGTDLAPLVRGPDTVRDALTPVQAHTLEALPGRDPVLPEQIARAAGLSVLDVVSALPALEARGLVEYSDGAWCLTRRLKNQR